MGNMGKPKRKKWLTVIEVRRRVAYLEEIRNDDEAAHAEEDSIHLLVLEEIAQGHPNPEELAAEAAKTKFQPFARQCA
jgi:hypothetical protein